MYNITFDLPNLSAGAIVQINGLGTFENGKTHFVDKDQAEAFRVYHQNVQDVTTTVTDEETGKEIEVVQQQVVAGQTLLQAFENTVGVTVETADAPPKESAKDRKAREAAEEEARKAAENQNGGNE